MWRYVLMIGLWCLARATHAQTVDSAATKLMVSAEQVRASLDQTGQACDLSKSVTDSMRLAVVGSGSAPASGAKALGTHWAREFAVLAKKAAAGGDAAKDAAATLEVNCVTAGNGINQLLPPLRQAVMTAKGLPNRTLDCVDAITKYQPQHDQMVNDVTALAQACANKASEYNQLGAQ